MSVLSLKDKLADAEKEYHNLITGNKARVLVDQNGERVEFTSANRQELLKYIQQLRADITGGKSVLPPATLVF